MKGGLTRESMRRKGTPVLPDIRGYFGEFGGRFVSETLMSALLELEKSFREAWRERAFRDEFRETLADYSGRPTPLYFAESLSRETGGGGNLAQTGGSKPHGCPQDHKCHWPGPAGTTNGKKPFDRRDRGRPAWGRYSHCCGSPRVRVPDLHGIGGCPEAGPECLSHEASRFRGLSG